MTGGNDRQTAFLLAEAGIRQLYARYADAVWRQDSSAFADCFTSEAVWKIAGQALKGRDAIAAFFEQSVGKSRFVSFWTGLPIVQIDGNSITARVQVTELMQRKGGEAVRTLGTYYDRFAGSDADWRFIAHHYELRYLGPPDLSGPLMDYTDYGPPPGQPGPDDSANQP